MVIAPPHLNRRMRDVAGVFSARGTAIGLAWSQVLGRAVYEVVDGVPVPLMRRCRGDRHRCFANEAAVGGVTAASTMGSNC
jgi:hypothetical protein